MLNVSEERVNVTELFPGVTYNFTVTAYNDIGNSSESENTPVRTLDEGMYKMSRHLAALYVVHLACRYIDSHSEYQQLKPSSSQLQKSASY